MAVARLAEVVVDVVNRAAKLHKGLRKGRLELSRDVLILISSLKPAVLLDYVSVQPQILVGILQEIQANDIRVTGHTPSPTK